MDRESIGVIKGRFQTYEPHEGHRHTIGEVLARHAQVLIILGTTYDTTTRDPLPYELRKMMLEGDYPGRVTVIRENSSPSSYKKRSRELTELIQSAFPGRDAVLYGARDSIVHTYQGPFRVMELPTLPEGWNATAMREGIPYRDSIEFRKGYIRAVMDKKPVFHQTVDLAITAKSFGAVVMIGLEEDEGKLRFPGAFFIPGIDTTIEGAGMRCADKEVPNLIVGVPQILGSHTIDDWRYRKTRDGILTFIVQMNGRGDQVPRPGVGIATAQWVDFGRVPEVVAPVHAPIAEFMANRWYH